MENETRRNTGLQIFGLSSNGPPTLFFYYDVSDGDELSGKKDRNGETRGGKTFWGTLALIQKTFGMTHRQVMHDESWINLVMKMRDMPYFHYNGKTEEKAREGTIDDLKAKFGKYITP